MLNVSENVPELDLIATDFNTSPHRVLAALRSAGGLAKSQRGWEVLNYDAAVQVISNPRLRPPDADHALSRGATPLMASFVRDGLLLDMEPEKHTRVRRVMGRAFALRRIDERKDVMRQVANDLIDEFADKGRCNFIADFTHKYSVRVLCSLLGVDPEDIPRFGNATTELRLMSSIPLEPMLPRIDAALQTLWDYSRDLVERKTANPGEDFISGLIEAQQIEGKLSEPELVWGISNLLFAGHETTRNQLACVGRTLAENPGAWEAMVADPEIAPQVMFEAIRYYPVVFALRRVAHEPVEIEGASLEPGSMVVLNMLAISRDPARFPEPNRFDWTRPADAYGINFGMGIHHCLGHALAKAEMIEALGVMRERFRSIRIDGDIQHTVYSGALGGMVELPLAFELR